MKTDPFYIIKKPVITEESTIQTHAKNQYVFAVDPRANKSQIRDAIEHMFPTVKVLSVNTMNYDGKTRRRGRTTGKRANWKKAVVKLRQGDAIDLIG